MGLPPTAVHAIVRRARRVDRGEKKPSGPGKFNTNGDKVVLSIAPAANETVQLSIQPPVWHACSECGVQFSSRNTLFKHLKATCRPAVATMPPPKAPLVRIALAFAYVGHNFHGVQLNSATDEKVRPSLAGLLLAAVRRAWGDEALTGVCRFAVRTEKSVSAQRNLFVLSLRGPCSLSEVRLRAELPAVRGAP